MRPSNFSDFPFLIQSTLPVHESSHALVTETGSRNEKNNRSEGGESESETGLDLISVTIPGVVLTSFVTTRKNPLGFDSPFIFFVSHSGGHILFHCYSTPLRTIVTEPSVFVVLAFHISDHMVTFTLLMDSEFRGMTSQEIFY